MISELVTQVRTGRQAAAAAATTRATRQLRTSLVRMNHDNVQLRPRPSPRCHSLTGFTASQAVFSVGESVINTVALISVFIIIIIIHSLRHKTAHKTYKTYKKIARPKQKSST